MPNCAANTPERTRVTVIRPVISDGDRTTRRCARSCRVGAPALRTDDPRVHPKTLNSSRRRSPADQIEYDEAASLTSGKTYDQSIECDQSPNSLLATDRRTTCGISFSGAAHR